MCFIYIMLINAKSFLVKCYHLLNLLSSSTKTKFNKNQKRFEIILMLIEKWCWADGGRVVLPYVLQSIPVCEELGDQVEETETTKGWIWLLIWQMGGEECTGSDGQLSVILEWEWEGGTGLSLGVESLNYQIISLCMLFSSIYIKKHIHHVRHILSFKSAGKLIHTFVCCDQAQWATPDPQGPQMPLVCDNFLILLGILPH